MSSKRWNKIVSVGIQPRLLFYCSIAEANLKAAATDDFAPSDSKILRLKDSRERKAAGAETLGRNRSSLDKLAN
jgi:hypothetical protein